MLKVDRNVARVTQLSAIENENCFRSPDFSPSPTLHRQVQVGDFAGGARLSKQIL